MEITALKACSLFAGVPAGEVQERLQAVPYSIQRYEKGETVFHLMEEAARIGIVLTGRVQAQKTFANGSQVNVSVRRPGDLIGPAAVFSAGHRYPCDVVALEPASILMLQKENVLSLLQKDVRILENFTAEIATATSMLQQRLELLSYSGIAQKAAFYLLVQARQTGSRRVAIPQSITNFALVMNVSRPSLHRELKRLQAQGLIVCAAPWVEIKDAEALEALLRR